MAAVSLVDECEYELDRKRKIKENNDMMKKIFGEEILRHRPVRNEQTRTKPNSPYLRRKTKAAAQLPLRRNPRRNGRSYHTKQDSEESEDEDSMSAGKLLVHWVGPLTKKRRIGSPHVGYDMGETEYLNDIDRSTRRKCKTHSPRVVRPASDFTEDDLLLVANCTSAKKKDPFGTTCHQCRQKTDDLKTVCRNESCIGIRGQFCGPCLRNRYGESVKDALLDPDWSCPPCRNICNCSFCMVKRGRRCTGQMINVARQNGFKDVRSFLGD